MDTRERLALEYDHEGEPTHYFRAPIYRFVRPHAALTWTDGDICVCGIKCARHWNAAGDWLGCTAAKEAK